LIRPSVVRKLTSLGRTDYARHGHLHLLGGLWWSPELLTNRDNLVYFGLRISFVIGLIGLIGHITGQNDGARGECHSLTLASPFRMSPVMRRLALVQKCTTRRPRVGCRHGSAATTEAPQAPEHSWPPAEPGTPAGRTTLASFGTPVLRLMARPELISGAGLG
jgi:hypothetical protein